MVKSVMAGLKIDSTGPVTQSAEAVKALIASFHRGWVPEEMPPFFRMSGELVLVQSVKGDVYYTTTPKDCTCPARAYHPGAPCKHQKRFFLQDGEKRTWLDGKNGSAEAI